MKYGQLNNIKYVVFGNTITLRVENNGIRRFRFKCSDFLYVSRFSKIESVSNSEFLEMFNQVHNCHNVKASENELQRLISTDYYIVFTTANNRNIIVRRVNTSIDGFVRFDVNNFEFWGVDIKSDEKFKCLFELTYNELCALCDDVKMHIRR